MWFDARFFLPLQKHKSISLYSTSVWSSSVDFLLFFTCSKSRDKFGKKCHWDSWPEKTLVFSGQLLDFIFWIVLRSLKKEKQKKHIHFWVQLFFYQQQFFELILNLFYHLAFHLSIPSFCLLFYTYYYYSWLTFCQPMMGQWNKSMFIPLAHPGNWPTLHALSIFCIVFCILSLSCRMCIKLALLLKAIIILFSAPFSECFIIMALSQLGRKRPHFSCDFSQGDSKATRVSAVDASVSFG